MTVIVGLEYDEGVLIAADTQGSNGHIGLERDDTKTFTAHGISYGFTSSYRMGQILKYHTEEVLSPLRETDLFGYVVSCLVPMYRRVLGEHGFKKNNSGEETGGTFLIGIDGKLFSIEDDFQVEHTVSGYNAVGCGYQLALGSMHSTENLMSPHDRVTFAVQAAIKFSTGCGGSITVLDNKTLETQL